MAAPRGRIGRVVEAPQPGRIVCHTNVRAYAGPKVYRRCGEASPVGTFHDPLVEWKMTHRATTGHMDQRWERAPLPDGVSRA